MRRRRAHSGFTLIEIVVVLAIVGLLMAISIRGIRSLAKSDLRANAARMSGAVRYLFDRASTTGKYHRLVIDVDTGKYWAEASDDRFYIPRDPETEASLKKLAALQAEQDERTRRAAELATASGDVDLSKVEVQEFKQKRVRFNAFQETALKPVVMKNTRVMDVYTPRVEVPVVHGQAYVYFFPLGQAEPAIIHLSDVTGTTIYSLVVHPVTGRVRILNEYVKPPLDDRVDDTGEVVAP